MKRFRNVKLIFLMIISIFFFIENAKSQISLIPNPSASDSGFVGNPIVYNNNLFFQYINSNGKYQLAKYDGNLVSLIPNLSASDLGIIGKAVEYNGMLYFIYQNNNGKRLLANYNGTIISLFQNLNTNDYGIYGTPFEYNGNLYFSYQNSSNNYQLAKFNGSNISLINNPDTADYGCIWSPIIYNNKLFFGYYNNTNHSYLANYDGNNLNIIPNPDTSRYGFRNNLIVYDQSIYFNYNQYDPSNWPPLNSNIKLAKFDGNNIIFIGSSDYSYFSPILYKNNLLLGLSYIGVKMGTHWTTSALTKWNNNDIRYLIEGTYNDFSPYHNYGYRGNSILFNNCIYFINNTLYNSNSISKYNNVTVNNILSPNVSDINYFGDPIIFNYKLFYCFEDVNFRSYLAKYDGYGFEKILNSQISDKGVRGNLIIFNNTLFFQYQNSTNKFQLAKYIDTIFNTPAIFDVSSGGTYLSCDSGSNVKLSGSQTNTMYYLYKNNTLNDSMTGTANELIWYNKTVGNYFVKAKNIIGTVNMNGNAVINIANYLPSPASLFKGIKNVCTGMSNVIYKVDTIAHATSYIWRLPNGKLDTTLNNSISVSFDTNTVATYISVKGHNCFADGDSSYINILLNQLPGTVTTISGPDSVCQYSNAIYSVPSVANATSYIWNSSLIFWSISDLSDSIASYFDNNSPPYFISVKASNCMGTGDSTFKIVYKEIYPSNAGQIMGLTLVNKGQNNVLYKVPPIANAKNYQWDLPAGYIGQSDSNSILINFGPNAQSGEIKVRGSNSCGYGQSSKLSIYIPDGLWQNTNVFNSYSDVISLESSGGNIFAGGVQSMVISNNKAVNWSPVNNVPVFANYYYYGYNDFTLIDSVIFAAFNYFGIYKTYNRGTNWNLVNNGLTSLNIRNIISGNNKILATGIDSTLFYSTRDDTVWTILNNGLPLNVSILPLAIEGDTFYVATNNNLYKSVNNGLSWLSINNGLVNTKVLTMKIIGNTLYAGTTSGVYVSNNGGSNWIPINNGINNYSVNCIAIKDNKIFIGTLSNGVMISINNGNTWCPINDGLSSMQIYALAIIDSVIYAGTSGGLWKRLISDFAYIQGTNNAIQGPTHVCRNSTATYTLNPIPNATSYTWTLPNGVTGVSISNNITLNFGATSDSVEISVKKTGDSVFYKLKVYINDKPELPVLSQYQNYEESDGLPSDNVKSLAIDKNGNLWIATYHGFSKFDGINFTNYQQGILTEYLKKIVVDNQNIVWFINSDNVGRFDGVSYTFFNITNSTLNDNYFYDLKIDNQNNIWVSTTKGYSKFDGQNWINYPGNGISNELVYTFAFDHQNNIWLSQLNGVCFYNGFVYQHYNTSNSGLIDNNVKTIAVDAFNNVWFGTANGISKFDGVNWTNYNSSDNPYIYAVKCIAFDNQDNQWFGVESNVLKFDGTNWTEYGINYSSSIVFDENGFCWVAANDLGLYSIKSSLITGKIKVCQGQNGVTYSIPNIPNTTSYFWQLPNGTSGSSSTNNIIVNFSNTAQSGNISVMAHNNCGNSDTVYLHVVVKNCTGINEVNKTVSSLKVFPNPFSYTTIFTYTLSDRQKVNLSIYDITGRLVKQLADENQSEGEHTLTFNAGNLQSGIYYYRLQAGDELSTGKMILAK